MEAVYKSGGVARQAAAETPLVLDRPSIVSLKIAPESVLKYERRGNDLVLVLRDGQEVAVRGFFTEYPDGGRNDLVLEDAAGVQWWGQYTAPWKDFHFTEIEWNDAGGALLPDGVPGWLLGALGVLGVGAAASGGGGGGGGGPAFIPPMLPPQNRNPEGKAEPVVTDQDKPVQGQVNATDPDRDALSFTVAKGPEHGTVTVDPSTGQFVYTPKPGYEGPDSFEVTVSDGKGGTTTVKVPVTVSPVNDAPTAPDYSETTPEDTPVSGRVTGSDLDSGDTLTYTKGSDPSHGTVTVNPNGTYTYTPATNFNGTDSFTVTVSDGKGGTTTSTITVTIDPVNDAPTVPNYTKTTNEDTPVSGQVTGSDVDGDALTYTKGSDPAHGTVTVNPNGTYTYTPATNFNGTDSFTVTVSDGKGGTTTSTVTVTVDPVNDAPSVPDYTKTTDEDTPVSGQVTGSDVDGDTLTYTKGSDPAHGTVTVNPNGTYTYTPATNFNGTDSFTVTVSDGKGGTTTSTVTVTVDPVNDAPTVPNYTKTTNEDTPVSGQVTGSDVDGDTLTYTKGSDPAHGTVTVNPDGTYTYTPGANFNGTDSFTVTVSDGKGGTTTSTVMVTIDPVNDAPVFVDGGGTPVDAATGYVFGYDENRPAGTVLGTVRATDVDSATVTYSILSGNDNGYFAIDPATGAISLTAAGAAAFVNDYEAGANAHALVVGANDGTVTTSIPVTLNEQNINDAPTAPNDTKTTNEDTPVSGQIVGSDVDGDTLTYTKGSDPAHGTVTVNPDGTYTYVPATNFNGTDSFTITVSDGKGGTTTSTITVTIDPVNDAPTVPNYTKTTNEDTPVSGQVTGSDVDGDTLTYTKGSDPSHGTVTVNPNGTYTYTPATNFNGTDSFTVTVSDGKGGTTTSTVTVTVDPVNDAPVFVDGGGTPVDAATGYVFGYDENRPAGTVLGTVRATDVDSATVTYSILSGNDDGYFAIDPVTGAISLTAAGAAAFVNDFEAASNAHALTVGASDGTLTTTIKVTLNEQDINEAPTAPNYTKTTNEDTPVTGQVTGSDVDGDTLTYTKGSDPSHGTVTVNPDGTYTYVPAANFNGTDSFTVTVSDGKGGTTTSTVTVMIDPVNDAPTVPNYTKTTNEDTPVSGQVTGSDVDGDTLTYTKGSDPSHGTVTVNPDGTYTYTPGANFNGTDSFTVTVSDGKGGTTTSTVTVTIDPVNDAPVFVDGGGTPVDTTTGYVFGYDENRPAGTVQGTVRATDVDSATVTYSILSGNDDGYFAIDPMTGAISLTAAGAAAFVNDFEAASNAHALVVGANDGTVTTTISVTLNEQDVNEAPTAPNYTQTTNEDTPVNGQVVGSDVDGDTLTYTKGSDPSHGTVTVNPDGTYTYTPAANFNGTDSFTVTVSDGKGGTTTSTVTVTIDPVNDAPVFVDGGGTPVNTATGYVFGYDENRPAGTVLGTVRATDIDSTTVTYSILSGNDDGYFAIDPATGAISLTAAGAAAFVNDFEAASNAHALTVVASDGTTTTTIKVTLNEQDINDAPTAPDYTKTTNEDTPVNGQIIGSDVDGDTLTYTKGSNPSHGTVTVNPNGTYTYVPAANFNGTDSFTVTVSDGKGGTTTSTVTVTVDPVNDAPTATVSAPGIVSEGSLPGGIAGVGEPPAQTSGTISITDPDSAAGSLSVSLSGPTGVTSGGQPVTWTWDAGTHTLTGSVTVGGVTKEVMTVAVGNVTAATGAGQFQAGYTVTLKGPIDHPAGNGEAVSNLHFTAQVSDGQLSSAPVGFDVPVKDDAPVLSNGQQAVDVAPIHTNLMVILDLSGSMGEETPTRLSRAKTAIQNLIDGYDLYGDVRVQLVTFSTTGQARGWMTASEAKTLVQGLVDGGSTNYDAALAQAMSGFATNGKLQSAQNVSYFLTDGEPTRGDGNTGTLGNTSVNSPADHGIQPAEEAIWTAFLNANKINSFALGLGTDLAAAAKSFVDPIAHNGITGAGADGQIITNTSQLNDVLQGTISVPPTISNLLTGDLGAGGSGFGADGGHVSKLTLDGTTYTYDSSTGLMTASGGGSYSYNAATHQVTVTTTHGGKLVVNFDSGEFAYQAAPRTGSSVNYDETLSYQVTDRDGDVSNVATQTLHVNYSPAAAAAALFASPDSLGLAGLDEATVSLESQSHSPLGESPAWHGLQLSDMLQAHSAAESLHALLQAAFPPAFGGAQAPGTATVLSLASSADSLAAYAPPVASSLDDELHTGLALHH
ncbi:tandem-95 repeat protein [Acidovorax cavernicola]|uniref:Tandem-95 repeat protein n=1 Tax=Acidovorax cavernicola TaxID=1675792 RepID=A0A9X8GWT4_9BURK|nr:Ig-like domain-containing protein [Acidovorax cavernicola]RIX82857.1 tandem-95 repeat protein [Acidovorax cavernicola]